MHLSEPQHSTWPVTHVSNSGAGTPMMGLLRSFTPPFRSFWCSRNMKLKMTAMTQKQPSEITPPCTPLLTDSNQTTVRTSLCSSQKTRGAQQPVCLHSDWG